MLLILIKYINSFNLQVLFIIHFLKFLILHIIFDDPNIIIRLHLIKINQIIISIIIIIIRIHLIILLPFHHIIIMKLIIFIKIQLIIIILKLFQFPIPQLFMMQLNTMYLIPLFF